MRQIYGEVVFHGEEGIETLVAVRYGGKYRLQFPSRGENGKPFFLNRGFGRCDWTAEELLKQWRMDVSKPIGYLDKQKALEHEGRFPVE